MPQVPRESRSKSVEEFQSVLESSTKSTQKSKSVNIREEIAREKKLQNDDVEQDILLKKSTLDRLFRFLGAETIVIFTFTLMQATHAFNFQLEEWSFKLLTTVTIVQITAMLFVAVSYLFPKNKSR